MMVYYNPYVDIALLTEGLEGLFFPNMMRSHWNEVMYHPALGYDLSHITHLGMLWCNSAATLPLEGGHVGDLSSPWVFYRTLSERHKTRASMELGYWIRDFIRLLRGNHRPMPMFIELLDTLNRDFRAGAYIGLGIDILPARPYRILATNLPQLLVDHLGHYLNGPLEETRAHRAGEGVEIGDDDWIPDEARLQVELKLCRVRRGQGTDTVSGGEYCWAWAAQGISVGRELESSMGYVFTSTPRVEVGCMVAGLLCEVDESALEAMYEKGAKESCLSHSDAVRSMRL